MKKTMLLSAAVLLMRGLFAEATELPRQPVREIPGADPGAEVLVRENSQQADQSVLTGSPERSPDQREARVPAGRGDLLPEPEGAGRSLVATRHGPAQTDTPRELYQDQEFRIVAVSYGTHGLQTPGFYVFGKESQRWVRIDKVSLHGSILGRSPALEESLAAGTGWPSIAWDFCSLAKQDYVDFPLKQSGVLFFPDRIERDEARGYLIFRFNSALKMASAETVLRVSLTDIRSAMEF